MSCSGGYVLIIDDDVEIRSSLTEIVGIDFGHNVKAARDGCEALGILSRSPAPSFILVDLMMPGMDGPEFIARKTQEPTLADIPFCVMTASVRWERTSLRSIFGREVPVLRKPFALEELLSLVERYC